jgi:predicted RecA/RadA family phage recombinase
MAINFKFSGKRITIKNVATAVEGGAIARRAGIIGIPLVRGAAGASVSFALEGVWGMTFAAYAGMLTASTPKAGTVMYWDTTADALSIGRANDDYAAVKCITDVSAVDGSFQGLLLPQGAPIGQDQS